METESTGGFIAPLASAIGASENALLLLLSLLCGYPLGFIYRSYLYGKEPALQHVYFTVCGLLLCYINFGDSVIHSVCNILLMYLVLLATGGTTLSVILAFILNMGYLCIGYYMTMTDVYVVKWTTPHCVLTLRLIGLTYDIYDGKRKVEHLSKEQKETALEKIPSLLEILGHTFFFGGFLVGPQFPMKRYLDFVNGAFSDPLSGGPPDSVKPALMRLSAGIGYTALFQITQIYFYDEYLISQEFVNSGFFSKVIYIFFWGKFVLYKYVAAWVITEGACILTGLTYNGKDENGNNLWDGCANIYIRKYESACKIEQFIQAFNVNTNRWMAKYVFKRLKFMGNKYISQGVTLFFLALWHGFASGYFMNFFLEFVMVNFEKQMEVLLAKSEPLMEFGSTPVGATIFYIVKKFYSQFALSYALVSFCLFSYDKYLFTYWSVWMIGHIIFMGLPLYAPLLMKILPRKPRNPDKYKVSNDASTSQENSNSTTSESDNKKEL